MKIFSFTSSAETEQCSFKLALCDTMCHFTVDLIPSCFTIPFFSWSVDHRQHNKVSKQLPVIEKKEQQQEKPAAAGSAPH